MADRLRVTELDFDTIKQNLKNFLKQQSEFQDYDFDGAGLSVLLDILAYNTHYNAYYLNMVANESFLDTALLRDSVVSHAKVLNYTPYSIKSPVSILNLELETNSTASGSCTLPEGFSFLSNQIDSKAYNFVLLDEVTVTKANTKYVFEDLEIHEGQLITYSFNYDASSNPKSIFQLPDSNIDTSTIKVRVVPNIANSSTIIYEKVTDVLDVTSTSPVFFLQESRSGFYEIYFGNGVVGKSLPDGSAVVVTYLVTNGTNANKANNFVATSTITDSNGLSLSNFTIIPQSEASGGSDRESVDNIKFSAAARFSTQNRLVTFKDYETYLLNNYPNLDSISVWGGEDNDPPVYGLVFVSMKPKNNFYISETEKQRIIDDIITPKSIVSTKTQILDPEYLYIIIDSEINYDKNKTLDTEDILKTKIKNAILAYAETNLNKFDSKVVNSKLEFVIDSVDTSAIIGNKLKIRLQKRFKPVLRRSQSYTINFNNSLYKGSTTNKLLSSEFIVNDQTGIRRTVVFQEVPQSFTGISSISVVNPGIGYTTTPTVSITGDGIGAKAEAVIVNGSIESIKVTNRGINYTKAIVTISGGNGYGASATVAIDNKIGKIRTIYYDENAEIQIVNEDVGEIDYDLGIVTINDINITSVVPSDGLIRLTLDSEKSVIQSIRNTIATIDNLDPSSIILSLNKV